VDALGRYGRQNKAAGQAFVPGLLWSLIELLQQSAREKMISGAQRVREIIHYVEQQCGRPLTRDQVASVFEISGGHLTRLLRKVHDEGFQEMLCQLRLQQARDLLRHSTLNIEQIALRCGFTSANYFAQAFRRAEGVAPGTWRKRNVM
jgi:transcriptional regulator GlxA family with amidase domain